MKLYINKFYLKYLYDIIIIYILLLLFFNNTISANQCYSCSGLCHNEKCNCQMGSCESDYCYIERRPVEIPGVFRITKGCVKKPSRTQAGCDYDTLPDHIYCVCSGNFCNEAVAMRSMIRKNVTCKKCGEKNPNCDDTCVGHWCHEDSLTGISGCGYGPPSLPYFYKGPHLLFHRNRVCITMARGPLAKPRKHCICNSNMCNDFMRTYQLTYNNDYNTQNNYKTKYNNGQVSRSIYDNLPLYQCILCDVTSHDAKMTSNCKQNRCVGNYCTYGIHRVIGHDSNSMSGVLQRITERQGCINVTDHSQIQLGCNDKYTSVEQKISCACASNLCNIDVGSANNISMKYYFYFINYILLIILFLIVHYC
uniref:Activin_recp domain-containing protein n=1 Tax=Parastrongyloides trichosuri TaxID=131310 RepID=A0A0N4ZQG7_PARTI